MQTKECATCPIEALERVFSTRKSKVDSYRVKGTTIDVGSRDTKYRLDAVGQAYMRVYGLPDVTTGLHYAIADLGDLWRKRAAECEEVQAARQAISRVFGPGAEVRK